MAQLVEHIVHIDGVTGSSPVATTKKSLEIKCFRGFSFCLNEPCVPHREMNRGSNQHEETEHSNSCGFSFILDGCFVGSHVVHVESM